MNLRTALKMEPSAPESPAEFVLDRRKSRAQPANVAPKLPRYFSVDALVDELQPSAPIFCIHPATIRRNVERFSAFPGRALYAVKCNPHPFVLETLYEAGIRDFDVASLREIELVESLFGKAAGMFFNNPSKGRAAIKAASANYGIRFYTIDHRSELDKLLEEANRDDDLVVAVRLSNSSKNARYALSTKFGAPPEEAVELLRAVDRAGFQAGLSFHVGSQCLAPAAFGEALATCGNVIKKAGVPIGVLNVGGGFPAPYPGDEPAVLDHYFAAAIFGYQALRLPPGCLLFCEPGRSLVATAASVLTQVLLRKDRTVYLNDGIFGSLQELRHPKERRPARLIRASGAVSNRTGQFRVFGPTCDSDDVLGAPLVLPDDVQEGDWIEIGMMGAYSLAMQTQFNGFAVENIVAVDHWQDLKA